MTCESSDILHMTAVPYSASVSTTAYVPTTTHLFSSLQRPRQKYSHEEDHAVFFLYSWACSMIIIIEKLFYKVQERTEDNLNRP